MRVPALGSAVALKGLVRSADRVGHVTQQPPVWAAAATALAAAGGDRGRRAALRGSLCYGLAAVVANMVVKPVVGRPRPPEGRKGRVGPVTSSFPSGHAATDLAFSFGVAQEIPALLLPLSMVTTAAHWSLVRTRGHYAGDVIVGGVIGITVAFLVWKVWPPGRGQAPSVGGEQPESTRPQGGVGPLDTPSATAED